MRSWLISAVFTLAFHASALSAAEALSTVVITGANRGIGFEFARQYASQGWRVIATARDPAEAAELQALAAEPSDVRIEALDVADVASVDALAGRLRGQPVDVLINNAGMFGDPTKSRLGSIDYAQFDSVFRTNALGPLKVSEALLPNLKLGKRKRIVAISAPAGSLTHAEAVPTPGTSYFYRGSKAALNMFVISLSKDLSRDGIVVLAVSPGAVAPKLADGREAPNTVSIDRSVAGMMDVIARSSADDSGRYLEWSGESLPW